MKRFLVAAASMAAVFAVTVQANTTITTEQQKLSYSMGIETGKAFKMHGITIDPKVFNAGVQDGMTGTKPQMSQQEIKQTLQNFQKQAMAKMQQTIKASAANNLKSGSAFLVKNATQEGIKTTPSGLQYKVITKGTGAQPTSSDTVVVNYEGSLTNGKVFDSSFKRNQPFTTPVGNVIKGWQEALTMMHTGGTWMLYIPANLAYGAQGAPGAIPPNATLIFKVELLSIKNQNG